MMTSSSPPGMTPEISQREKVRALQAQLRKPSFQTRSQPLLSSPVLESVLPGGRLQEGSLVELLSACPGAGACELAFQMVKQLQQERLTPVLIDSDREFFAPGAAQLGIDLERLIVVRTRSLSEQLWAIEQTLRCEGRTVLLSLLERIPANTYRRLKLAAERGKGIGLFWRTASLRTSPSWADHRLLIEPAPSPSRSRRYKVTALNSTEGTSSHSMLECCHDSGALSVVPQLAHPKTSATVSYAS